jgi:hypothetical protein
VICLLALLVLSDTKAEAIRLEREESRFRDQLAVLSDIKAKMRTPAVAQDAPKNDTSEMGAELRSDSQASVTATTAQTTVALPDKPQPEAVMMPESMPETSIPPQTLVADPFLLTSQSVVANTGNLGEPAFKKKTFNPMLIAVGILAISVLVLTYYVIQLQFDVKKQLEEAVIKSPKNELPEQYLADVNRIYKNERFGFSLTYPANLFFPQMESNNGDGQDFLTKDGLVKITVSGINNVLSTNLEDEFDDEIRALKQESPSVVIGYSRLKEHWYVISGFRGKEVFYTKKFLVNDEFITLGITYPEVERAKWDKIVEKIASDFQLNTVADVTKQAEKSPVPIQRLLDEIAKTDDTCRGKPGDSLEGMAACEKRGRLTEEAISRGWCWGPQEAVGYQQHWMQCKDDPSNRQLPAKVVRETATPVESNRNVWFTPESSFTECIEARSGPAGRIEDSKGMNPSVVEKDGGRIVQVEAYRDQGRTIVKWMFYRDKAECERVETNVEKKLADKYR